MSYFLPKTPFKGKYLENVQKFLKIVPVTVNGQKRTGPTSGNKKLKFVILMKKGSKIEDEKRLRNDLTFGYNRLVYIFWLKF